MFSSRKFKFSQHILSANNNLKCVIVQNVGSFVSFYIILKHFYIINII